MTQVIAELRKASSFSNQTIDISFVFWKKYPSMKDQVKIVSETDIYVSGPGTGLLLSGLLSDGSVVVNLGEASGGYMEEVFVAASPHLKALYYDRCHNPEIEPKLFEDILKRAISLHQSCFETSDDEYDSLINLSPVGKSLVSFTKLISPQTPLRNDQMFMSFWKSRFCGGFYF